MVGRLAAAEIVVVHTGQIVVDQAVGVQHLDRTGDGHRRLDISAADTAELQHKHGADAFSSGEEAVAHRLGQPLKRHALSAPEGILQRGVNFSLVFSSRHFQSSKGSSTGAPSAPFLSMTTFCSA